MREVKSTAKVSKTVKKEIFISPFMSSRISSRSTSRVRWKMERLSLPRLDLAQPWYRADRREFGKDAGVYAPEYFDPIPYLQIMDEAGFEYGT